MPRRTIYLSDEDDAYIEAHRASVGLSLSAALMKGLRMVVAHDALQERGFEEVQVNLGRPGARRLKIFDGRVMARSRVLEDDGSTVVSRRVYVTPKGSWVYFERSDVNWDQWRSGESLEPGAGEMSASFDPATREGRRIFEVRDSLDGLAGVAPEELMSAARAAAEDTTSPVERLDI